MRAAIYARVSTTDQTCENQLAGAAAATVERRGWTVVGIRRQGRVWREGPQASPRRAAEGRSYGGGSMFSRAGGWTGWAETSGT